MELARQSIADLLARNGAFDVVRAAQVIARAASALAYLHSVGCVHRDVKPSNLLDCERGTVLGDLGIVRWSDLHDQFTSAGTLTRSSVQLGSWLYMAPEQLENPHDVVPASDTYSLGVTWYELLTGAPPSPQAVAAKRYRQPCQHEAVNSLISRMTNYVHEARPPLQDVIDLARSVAAS
jgi:serine/threonine-protein kinase